MRPGDYIRTVFEGISSRIAAFKFALHPRASKICKHGKKKRELEEKVLRSGLAKRRNIVDI